MKRPRGEWMQTYTGKRFWPYKPNPKDICPEDIAHHLANTCRYGGASKYFYSVAEHSVLVSEFVPAAAARFALLHDAAEAYTGDLITPIKYTPQMADFRRMDYYISLAIRDRFGVSWSAEVADAVDYTDSRIVIDESRELLEHPDEYVADGMEPLGAQILCMGPAMAKVSFLTRFYELFPEELG